MKRIIYLLAVLLLAVILTSCGGGGSGDFAYNCNVPLLDITYDQAIAEIDAMSQQGVISPKVHEISVSAMERLTEVGVSVSSAYQFVIAAIDHDMGHTDIAPLVVGLIASPCPTVTTDIATTAINNSYSDADDGDDVTGVIVGAVNRGAETGVGCDIPAEIVCAGIQRKVNAYTISSIMDGFVEDINNGLSPEEAKDNAMKKINN